MVVGQIPLGDQRGGLVLDSVLDHNRSENYNLTIVEAMLPTGYKEEEIITCCFQG